MVVLIIAERVLRQHVRSLGGFLAICSKAMIVKRCGLIRKGVVAVVLVFIFAYVYVLSHALVHPETRLLPFYLLGSMSRLILTYFVCLAFGLVVGIFAALNKTAGDIIIPFLDILQSVPVLGFFPFAVLIIVPVFDFGVASIVLLFTSMAWSIVFGVIAGVKSIPQHIQDMAAIFGLRGWAYLRHVVMPSIAPSLIAGSILAFGSGWYFLIASEYTTYGTVTYVLPGIGYYLNVASFEYADVWMSLAGIMTIGAVVFLIHRFVWLRIDKNVREAKFLNLHFGYDKGFDLPRHIQTSHQHKRIHFNRRHAHQWFFNIFRFSPRVYLVILGAASALLLALLLREQRILVSFQELVLLLFASMVRIGIAYIFAVAIAILIGYIMIRRPSTRKMIAPLADIMQSVPALAYFPLIYLILSMVFSIQTSLEIASIILLLLGMLWYLMFNVIEAVEHLPKDIDEVSKIYHVEGGQYVRNVLVPAVFPALITGSILAVGGGWNALIVAEYVKIGGQVHSIFGVGAALSEIAGTGSTTTLLVLLASMTAIVLALNHFVWRRLLNHASKYVLEED